MKFPILHVAIVAVILFAGSAIYAQDYVYAIGSPAFGVNIPIENGYINVANGNVHLEFPLAQHSQRGNLRLNERLEYDSRIWKIVKNGSNYLWQPTNVPNSMAGWRFVSGAEAGSIQTNLGYYMSGSCLSDGEGSDNDFTVTFQYWYAWTDPSGAVHPFDTYWTVNETNGQCYTPPNDEYNSGFALDASGYRIVLTGTDDQQPNISILDGNGTQVYPQVIDRYGNYWSSDSSGNLVDDLGRTPVITSTNGNQIYYDVLTEGGGRARYIVTTESLYIQTSFKETSVREFTGWITAIQSIQLPDGSSYSFGYNDGSYGGMTNMALPAGGGVSISYSNYFDSYQNVNRWLSSYSGGHGSLSFKPVVLTQCTGSQKVGCQEKMTVTTATGDDTVYTLTLNNGAWNTTVDSYQGSSSTGQKLFSTVSQYDFSQDCIYGVCVGAKYIHPSSRVTALPGGLQSQVLYGYAAPETGKISSVKEWDFYSGSPSATPTRETDYEYGNGLNFDLTQTKLLDSAGNQVALTSYTYTTDATATSNLVGHAAQNAGGPYLLSVNRWVNTSNSFLSTSYTYDDAGVVQSVTDPNGNKTTFGYDTGDLCITETDRPIVNGVKHVSKATCDASTGLVTSLTDENGNTTSYTNYDQFGRLLSVSYPDGGQATYSYPSPTQSVEKHLQRAQPTDVWITTTTNFDSYGRKSQEVMSDPQGDDTVDYAYDSNGRLYSVSNPHRSSSSTTDGTKYYSYDALGRTTAIKNPDGTAAQASYAGNIVIATDETGRQRESVSNAFGQLTNVFEPDSNNSLTVEADYQYNPLGNLMRVDQWGGPVNSSGDRVRTFTYDSLGRLITEATPESGTICYGTWSGSNCVNGYDENGNLVVKTDARGVVTSYSYDALNRLASKSVKNAPANTPSQNYIYDVYQTSYGGSPNPFSGENSVGRMTESYSSDNKTHILYSYSKMGQVTAKASCFSLKGLCGGWQNFDAPVLYTYDYTGNTTSLTNGISNQGIQLTYSYDDVGRLSTIASTWGGDKLHPDTLFQANSSSPPSYDPLGNLNYAQFGINIGSSTPRFTLYRPFDSRGRLSSKTYSTSQ